MATKTKAAAENAAENATEAAASAVVPAKIDRENELVKVKLFKDGDKYKDDVFVAINGERIKVQRGKTVMIKRKFLRVIEQSRAQDTSTEELMAREEEAFEQSLKEIN